MGFLFVVEFVFWLFDNFVLCEVMGDDGGVGSILWFFGFFGGESEGLVVGGELCVVLLGMDGSFCFVFGLFLGEFGGFCEFIFEE